MTNDVVVFTQHMGDVEDFDIYLTHMINMFYQSDEGKWCQERNHQLRYLVKDRYDYYYEFELIAEMNEQDAMLFKLAYGDKKAKKL